MIKSVQKRWDLKRLRKMTDNCPPGLIIDLGFVSCPKFPTISHDFISVARKTKSIRFADSLPRLQRKYLDCARNGADHRGRTE